METTFGKTVETRLINNYTSRTFAQHRSLSRRHNHDTELQIATENTFNLQQNKQFQINYMKLQKYKHELLYLKLKQHNERQAELEKKSKMQSCASSVLIRKNYQYLVNQKNCPNGYLSDSECFNSSPYETVRNNSYVQHQAYEDDARSCVSMRTSYNSRFAEVKDSRYKSLDRSKLNSIRQQKYCFSPKEDQNLTWKNFNYNPNNQVKQNKENVEVKQVNFSTAVIKKNKSMSTPGTPLMNLNKKFLNDDSDAIVLRQQEIEIQLKNIENLKKQQFFQDDVSSSKLTNKESCLNKNQLEVVSLENALLSMNEILKNLTNSTKRRDDEITKPIEFSPPLSTSTSFSSATTDKRKTQISEILTPTSISPSSSSTDYSNTSLDESKTTKLIYHTNTSFSPSESSNSCISSRDSIKLDETNSRVSDLSCSLEKNCEVKLNQNESNKKIKSLSFRKRIKQLFFSSSS